MKSTPHLHDIIDLLHTYYLLTDLMDFSSSSQGKNYESHCQAYGLAPLGTGVCSWSNQPSVGRSQFQKRQIKHKVSISKNQDNHTLYSTSTFLSALVASVFFCSSINFTKDKLHLIVLNLNFHEWSRILHHICKIYLSNLHFFCNFSVQIQCSFLSWGVNFSLLNFLY